MLTFHTYRVLDLPGKNTKDSEFMHLKECIKLLQEQNIKVMYLPNNQKKQYCIVAAVGIFQATVISCLKYVRMMVPTQIFHVFVIFLRMEKS